PTLLPYTTLFRSTASQQGGDGRAPGAPTLRRHGRREGRALPHAEPAHCAGAASAEAGSARVPAAAAASDQTVAWGEGAAARGEEARRAQESAAAWICGLKSSADVRDRPEYCARHAELTGEQGIRSG